jgi:hypothetical protein
LLSFVVLPFLIQLDAREYIKIATQRIKSALKSVILVYAIYAFIGVAAAITWYTFQTASVSFTSLCVILSTFWGLMQISFLMGYGLVEIPRSFRRRVSTQEMLEVELCKIDWLDQRREQSQVDLNILIATAKGMRLRQLNPADEKILEATFQIFSQ